MKKISTIILFLLFLHSCGYAPMYSKNQKVNFNIQSIKFDDGDKELASFIKSNLNNYFGKNTETNFSIDTKIKYQKIALSKNTAGKIEEYELLATIKFKIKSKDINQEMNISESFEMDNFSDEFEEREYELIIKENMARSITSKLLIQLNRFDVN